ncbi:MAG: hypothetical protein WC477_02060 [Patescibacteria group bacterium]
MNVVIRENKKKRLIGDVIGDFGFAFEFFKAISHAVVLRGGTMKHLKRVITEKTLQKQIAEMIVPVDEAAKESIAYSVFVDYIFPEESRLNEEYPGIKSKLGLSANTHSFYDHKRSWRLRTADEVADMKPGVKKFLVKNFGRNIGSKEAIDEMDMQGYRPATHVEAYAFAKGVPQCTLDIYAIGSAAEHVPGTTTYIVGFSNNPEIRVFAAVMEGTCWGPENWFLFVRK